MGQRRAREHTPDDDTRVVTSTVETSASAAASGCLVVLRSADASMVGRRIELFGDVLTIGRSSDNDICFAEDAVSRRHALLSRRGDDWVLDDAGSTNGTLHNGRKLRGSVTLQSGDQLRVGETLAKFLAENDAEARYHDEIYRLAVTDGLTGLFNKRFLFETLERELSRAGRHMRPLSLILLDIDHFKHVNDTEGHLGGDAVLAELALRLRARLRKHDVLGRYGGEEFLVILPETPLEGARKVAESMRGLVEGRPFPIEGHVRRITASFGVAALEEGEDAEALVARADARLYEAKAKGRNCVVG